ncbi:MAG: ATP-binding protein, partial [Anaerolineae bacterium]
MKANGSLERFPLSYHPLYFVDRDEALAVVLEKVRALLRGEPVRNRTTTYYGPRGSGKSWLIRELHHRLRDTEEFQGEVIPLFVALGRAAAGVPSDGFHVPADERAEKWPLLVVCDLLENIIAALQLGTPQSTSVDTLTSLMIAGFRRQKRPVVVLVDGVDEMPPEFLRQLE